MGLSQEELDRNQRFESEDEKRAGALTFAREVIENRGQVSDEALNAVREAGYTDEQIMEIIATVALATYTNYLNDIIGTELDIPVREPTGGR